MEKPIIKVDNITITYKGVNAISYRTIIKRLLGKEVKVNKGFDAVKNLSFELKKGENLGIVGENGSGKSTLLRTLAGVSGVDKGEVIVNCDKTSLLALGVGFQSRLTGLQNIYLSGYALGFTKKEIEDHLQDIIDFSELGDFINSPVKTYSSGMYSKLAFSISAILATEVLFVDEVLSVGDIRFKKKSYDKMKQMIKDENRSVIIVNHSVETLRTLCDKILWLHKGELKMFGDVNEVIDAYVEFMNK
ncbi:MAG: ABC transporter ATP-binding protein [Erysipelotrichaceae bacterium]